MAACCEGGTTPTGGYPYFLWCHGRAEMSLLSARLCCVLHLGGGEGNAGRRGTFVLFGWFVILARQWQPPSPGTNNTQRKVGQSTGSPQRTVIFLAPEVARIAR